MLFEIDAFFSNIPDKIKDLFDGGPLWKALDLLKGHIRRIIRPNLPDIGDIFQPGLPLASHVILLPEGFLTEGFEIVCNDETAGRIEVWIEGERVPKASLICAGAIFSNDQVQLGSGVVIEPGVMIKGPTVIDDGVEIRQGAYIRGDCFIGRGCIIGHTTEIKHSILMDGAKAGHFAYIGDSILGMDVNLGAGVKLANLTFSKGNVIVKTADGPIDTGRRKLGAILGDSVQAGCNSVTNPGVLLGRGSIIAPLASVAPGIYKPHSAIR
ncbi:MAG: hypothetical protein ACP5J5_02300 [Dissulfurimicrobium sp.]|uniref:hypothetical protein n=1 Tax=Dissulfurimicrobium TaxID=1769732 RepID=UPI001EDA9756|nr:hypothetical protein [Dissulfurimicrobium hydrothermale]UKL13954.1 hypothetical protein LGS26_01460 [Dissulfurimicrobium hydrothermale]